MGKLKCMLKARFKETVISRSEISQEKRSFSIQEDVAHVQPWMLSTLYSARQVVGTLEGFLIELNR